MPNPFNSELNESWIINENTDGDGDISWADDTEPSDVEEKSKLKETTTPLRQSIAHVKPESPVNSTLSASGLGFIMPTISERSGPRRPSSTKHSPRVKKNHIERNGAHAIVTEHLPRARSHDKSTGDKAIYAIRGVGTYGLDVITSALKTLKQPISWVLAAYLFAGLLVLVQNLFTSSIYSALSPICRVPGVSLLHLPICRSPYQSVDQSTPPSQSSTPINPEFDALMTVQNKFETVLEDSAAGVTLPLDMKRSETSIRDLRQVVRYSSIPSKNELLNEFDGFIETARIASYDLQKFNSHVGRAVDSVLSTARWTQRVLDDIAHKSLQSSGLFGDFINNRLLAPFQPLQFSESRLLDQYITHTRLISDEIEALIEEAQALLLVLINLEDRLEIIHSISLRDNLAAKSSRDEILSELWTFLGGNRAKLGKVDNQLRLLARVGEYRKLAYAHVAGTILKLQAMSTELEELRTRVGSAYVAHDRGMKGVPLSVHIEIIRLGVERLEGQREKARKVEKRHVKKVMDKATRHGEEVEQRALVEAL